MKKFYTLGIIVLIGLFPTLRNIALAQENTDTLIAHLKNRIDTTVTKNMFVTQEVMDSVFGQHQRALSGSEIKAGKSVGTSFSVSDNNATFNLALPAAGRFYPQVHISGTGKDDFVSIFKGKKYGNTLSGGGNVNWFYFNSGKYNDKNKNSLRERLMALDTTIYTNPQSFEMKTNAFLDERKKMQAKVKLLDRYLYIYLKSFDKKQLNVQELDSLSEFIPHAESLVKSGVLNKDFLKWTKLGINGAIKSSADTANLSKTVEALVKEWENGDKTIEGSGVKQYMKKLYLDSAQAIQMKAEWNTMRFHWLSVSADMNVSPYDILDETAVDDDYVSTKNDYFFSGEISYNILNTRLYGPQFRFYCSPTLRIRNARQYQEKDKITLQRYSPHPIGVDSTIFQQDLYSEVFPSVAARKWSWSVEVPFIFFWAKSNFGVEISPRAGAHAINGDNVGMKLGVFMPVEIKEGVPVVIQPMLRLQKLFEKKDVDFWKDNVVFGFNVSISLPKALGKMP